jgi:tetratricopeptide (TPR) repeat protein
MQSPTSIDHQFEEGEQMNRLKIDCLLIWLISLPMTTGLMAQNDAATQVRGYLQRGNQALKSGDWVEAEREYRAGLQLESGLFELHSNLGLACYFQQKYEPAEEAFLAALRINPNVYVPNFFLGIIYHRRGQFSKTLPLLTKATKLQPQDAEAHYWLGLNLTNSSNYEAAAKEIGLAIELGASNVDAFYLLGKTYAKLAQHAVEKAVSVPADGSLYRHLVLARQAQLAGNWSLARKYYAAARRQNGAAREIGFELGQVALGSSDWETAISEFQSALLVDPKSYRSHFGLAQAYLNLQETKKALFHLQQALNIRPEFFQLVPPAIIALSEDQSLQMQRQLQQEQATSGGGAALLSLWLTERQKDQALTESRLRDFESQRKMLTDRFTPVPLPRQATQLKQTAGRLLKNKRFEEAVRAYAALGRADAADPKIHLLLAEALSEIGKHKEAGAALRQYLHFYPTDGDALFRLAQCYEKLSVEAFGQISKIDATSYRNHQLLAESMLERSNWEGALKEFHSALAMKPNDSELYFGLGRAYLKAGRIPDAAEQFQTALELDPFDPSVTYSVGLCHYLNREPEKALHFLRKAVGQDPNLLAAREQLGRVLVMQGQHAEAVPELEAALPVDSDGSLHYLLSVCYRKLEQPEKAKVALEVSEQIRARNRELAESKVGEPPPP